MDSKMTAPFLMAKWVITRAPLDLPLPLEVIADLIL